MDLKMTTLRELVQNIDFENTPKSDPDWEGLCNLFQINNFYYSEDTRLKCYFIKRWICTDTHVGIRVYFLDGEHIAFSSLRGRKYDEEFTFISIELAKKLRDYLIDLANKENEFTVELIEDSELDKKIPNTFKIEFNSQILHKTAFLNGERVEIIRKNYDFNSEREKYFYKVEIKKSNGKKEEVHIKDLDFEYNV
jgi:hypothetical protein